MLRAQGVVHRPHPSRLVIHIKVSLRKFDSILLVLQLFMANWAASTVVYSYTVALLSILFFFMSGATDRFQARQARLNNALIQ